MKGKLENIGEINAVSSGSGKKGPWTLWSTKLTVDGNDYGYSDFDKKVLEDKVSKLKQGSIVEFETEENSSGHGGPNWAKYQHDLHGKMQS